MLKQTFPSPEALRRFPFGLADIALILGTLGIAIILIRSIRSRKKQYAMMQAYGISLNTIRKIILIEFMIVMFAGIVIGILASLIAGLPGFLAANGEVPFGLLSSIVLLLALNGFVWIIIGSAISVKKKFITDLRNE